MYVVTGGAGFIGSNIAAAIERDGLGKVVICDHLGNDDKWRNISKLDLHNFVQPENLAEFMGRNEFGIKGVVHMGAISSTVATDADLIFANNFGLSLKLWKWCALNKVPFIYASSAASYGDGSQGFLDDQSRSALAQLRPLNPYGWSKHQFDRRIMRMIEDGETPPPQWVGLKFFNVYGPHEYHKGSMQSVIYKTFNDVMSGKPATLFKSHNPKYEDGGQLRDFIWIDDCVSVILWFLENPDISGLFNCGTGKARSFLDLVKAVYLAMEKEPNINFIPTPEELRDKYQYFTQANMSKLKTAGYKKPFTTLEEGIDKYIRYYLNSDDKYRTP